MYIYIYTSIKSYIISFFIIYHLSLYILPFNSICSSYIATSPLVHRGSVVQVEVSVDWRLYDDLGHTVCWEELQDISDWMAERLKDGPQDGVRMK